MNIPTEAAQKRDNDYDKAFKRLEAQLAAERERTAKAQAEYNTAWKEMQQLREQLAAARRIHDGMEAAMKGAAASEKQLREQLADEREKRKAAEGRAETYHRQILDENVMTNASLTELQGKLAALQKDYHVKHLNYEKLELELAVAVEALARSREQIQELGGRTDLIDAALSKSGEGK